MSNSELKNNLHNLIEKIQDEKFLSVVHIMMKGHNENSDFVDEGMKIGTGEANDVFL